MTRPGTRVPIIHRSLRLRLPVAQQIAAHAHQNRRSVNAETEVLVVEALDARKNRKTHAPGE